MERYTKVRILGKGSYGNAILIKRRSDNAFLVIKEVFLGKMSKKEREEARRECNLLQQLSHPNIVRYVEHFENRNNLYIVMEYCDGGDLHRKLKHGPMSESTILYYYSQVCLAIEYLHSRYILHRDIKTMNVFLMKNGSVKLGDFGIATVLRNTMGMANTVCGTPYYFSPEICCNKPYNNKSDVWALGVLLYELATGRHPFDGSSMQQLMQRILRGTYPPLRSNFSPEFCKMVEWCLKKDPAKRPSIRQLLSLPILRRSLEQLEENLMLATQCRVRLKDIIDFYVGPDGNKDSDSNNNNSNGKEKICGEQPVQERKTAKAVLPSPRLAEGMSPGRLAAMALARQQGQRQHHLQKQPPSLEGASEAAAESPAFHFAQLGPKPSAAGVPVDHNRVENYRQQLQKYYQRVYGGEKFANPAASPAGNGISVSVANNNYSPRTQQVQIPTSAAVGALPKKHQPPLHQQKNAPQGVSDHRFLNNNDISKQKVACNNNMNAGEGFDERMQRINAIMQRYAQNVDPKARDTIRAYMKRKQDEYIQEQKEYMECVRRREKKKKEELAKVLVYQNKIARSDFVRQQQCRQLYNKMANYIPSVLPSSPVFTPTSVPSSPQKDQQQSHHNHHSPQPPPPLQPPPPPPPPPSQVQRQQYKHNVFGRDPRFVPLHMKELESHVALQSREHALKDNGSIVENIRPAVWKRNKLVAINSPIILGIPKPHFQLPVQYPALDPLLGSNRPHSAQLAAAVARQAPSNHNGNVSRVNRKRVPLQPVNNKQESLVVQTKIQQPAQSSVVRRPVQLAPKGCVFQIQQKKQQHQGDNRAQSTLRIISAPAYQSSLEGSSSTNDEGVSPAKKTEDRNVVTAALRMNQQGPSRRSSAPLERSVVGVVPQSPTNLLGKPSVCGESKIFSTAAAGFVPLSVSSPSLNPPRRGSLESGSHVTPKSPLSYFSKEDLPASVEDRRGLERQLVQLAELKLHAEERSGKDNVTPRLHFQGVGMEINNNNNNNIGSNKCYRKRGSNTAQSVDEKEILQSVAWVASAENGQSDGRRQKKNLPPALGLAPLQIRSTHAFLPQCSSPSLVSSPFKGGAGRTGRKQSLPRVTANNNAPQQAIVGNMPFLHGVKMPAHPRAAAAGVVGGTGAETCDGGYATPHGTVIEPPLLVDIEYAVSQALVLENVGKHTAPVEANSSPNLPFITDSGVLHPDVGQQWRDITESGNCHKIAYRPQYVHPRTSLPLETQTTDGDCDVLAAFQKAGNARLIIPSTLEALGTLCDNEEKDVYKQLEQESVSTLTFPKQKQKQKNELQDSSLFSVSNAPGMISKAPLVPLSFENVFEKSLSEVVRQPSQELLKTTSNSDGASLFSLDGSWNDAMGTEEREALVAFVDENFSARTSDELENCNNSVFSSDNQREHSLEGYLEMLDHLRKVLHSCAKHTKFAKAVQGQLSQKVKNEARQQEGEQQQLDGEKSCDNVSLISEKKKTPLLSASGAFSSSDVEDLPTPMDFGCTRANCEHHEDPHMQLIQAMEDDAGDHESVHDFDTDKEDYDDSAEEEVDEEEYDDDDDFEDALPLSPVRCATLNDTYRRLLKNTTYLTELILDGEGLNDEAVSNSNVETGEV